jgi:hypothetical protein
VAGQWDCSLLGINVNTEFGAGSMSFEKAWMIAGGIHGMVSGLCDCKVLQALATNAIEGWASVFTNWYLSNPRHIVWTSVPTFALHWLELHCPKQTTT